MSGLIRIIASAGAGKTYKLSLRYIDLLAKYNDLLRSSVKDNKSIPDIQKALKSIIAITFTNKAAAEMKERIIKFLKEIAFNTDEGRRLASQLSTPITQEEAELWVDAILENYSCFQVRTIDSLLFSILKGLSFELDLASDLEVVFDKERLFGEAFERLLYLASLEEGKSLWEGILKTYLEIDERGGFYPEGGIRHRLKEVYNATKGRIKDVPISDNKDIKALKEDFKRKCENVYKLAGKKLPSDGALTLEKQLPDKIEDMLKSRFDHFLPPDAQIALDDFRKAWRALFHAEIERCFQRVCGYAEAIKKLKELMDKVCREQGIVVGGEDWTLKVMEKLKEEPEIIPFIYAIFGTRFKHFLFDEFQDTSRDQFDALFPVIEEALSSGGSLFVVGDVKQAIYGWRGGDSRLFFRIPEMFASASENLQVLEENYRSAGELVEFFNKVFSQLEDTAKVKKLLKACGLKFHNVLEKTANEVSKIFEKCSQKPKAIGISESGRIKIFSVETRGRNEMKVVVKSKLIDILKSEWNPLESTAILVRTNKDAEEVAQWLFQEGYPVVTENSLRLKSSRVVMGLLNLLDYLYSRSEASLYGFLSSGIWPWLSENKLFKVWFNDKERLAKEVEHLVQGAGFFNARSPYEALRTLMRAISLEERIEDDLSEHKPFVERLLDVAHLFELEEGPNMGKFLEYVKKEGFDSRVGLPDNVDAIQVITVHKAKGLEFDTVFVPFTDWTQIDRAPLGIYDEKLVHLRGVVKLDEKLGAFRDSIFAETLKEHLNLFYVAVTRARKRLYLFLTKKLGDFISIVPLTEEIIKRAGYDPEKLVSN